jgi:hypothetical protein
MRRRKKLNLDKITPEQASEEFVRILQKKVQLCSSDIQRHAMQDFIHSPLPREQQYRLALRVAEVAYSDALASIDAWFLDNAPKTPTN